MKRLISISLFFICLLLGSPINAQTYADLLASAEQVKDKYGEQDDRYLDALSKVISVAFDEEKYEEANKYRLLHSEIVKEKYGENSFEYAEDIWRLGNVSDYKGEAYTFDCYKKVQRILETINAKDSFIYFDLFWSFFWHYRDQQNWLLASINMQKYIEYATPWINKEWKGNAINEGALANAYYLLGINYFAGLNDYGSAIESLQSCISILEENDLVSAFPNSITAYRGIWLGYENLKDYNASLEWHLKCLSAAEQLKGEYSDEYLEELSSLRYCYYTLEDFDSTEKVNLALLSNIEKRNELKGTNYITDSLYVKEYESLVSLCVAFKKDPEVILYGSKLSDVYKQKGEDNSESSLLLLDNMILAYHNIGDYITEYSLFPRYEELSVINNKLDTELYYDYLGLKAEALTFLYRLDEYNQVIIKRKELTAKLYGKYSEQSFLQEFLVANQLMSLDKREDAEIQLKNCFEIIESGQFSFEQDPNLYMANIHNLEGQIYTPTDPDRAEKALKKAIEESNTAGIYAYAPLVNMGLLYYSIRQNPRKAVEYFFQAKEELEKSGDNQSVNYLTVLNDIGLCYQDLGLSSLAISIFDLAQGTAEHVYGKSHPIYANILQNKSSFYAHITDYDSAIKTGEEARACLGTIYGFDSEKYGICTQNLGLFYQEVNQYDKAKELLLETADIFSALNSQYLIYSYTNLLACYAHDDDRKSFDEIYDRGNQMLTANNWIDTDIAGTFMGNVGYCLITNGNAAGKDYLGYALKVFENTGKQGTLQYFTALIYYLMATCSDNTNNESDIPYLYGIYKDLYINNAAFYNADERASYVTSPRYSQVKNILFSSRNNGEYDTTLYDYLLFSKGLLLGTSLNYAKAVYDSGNEDVINNYIQYQRLSRYINGENVLVNGNPSIEEAKEQASVIERQITLYLRQNGGYTDGLSSTYSDVRDNLKSTEVAIEFVTFRNYYEDTEYVAALLSDNLQSSPKYVQLCKKSDLEKFLSVSPAVLYGETSASKEAYDLIWSPLIPYLEHSKTVYFSPAGYINKIAIEHLFNGEKRFDSMFDVVRLTSTREICGKKAQYKYSSAVLYGGLKYDEDDETMVAESRSIRGAASSQPDIFRGFSSSMTRSGWEYLPGTLEEINQISTIISKNKISCDVYTSTKGNEESFKALSGNNIGILHIATHGFYMTESQAERNEFFFTTNPFATQSDVSQISPLQRSGLLMAGGNKAWKGETVPEGVEDGILTASEIASMDLNSCDVVVLSACETGLGEITDEGVFGLQRAFKNAGVNTIIMSLWEVDDQATSLMMQTFYRNLVRGKSKRESFTLAQSEVRKKYEDPRYWAAFIMLD